MRDKNKKDYLIQVLKIGINKNFKILLLLMKNMEKMLMRKFKKLSKQKLLMKLNHMLKHFGKESMA